jgi:hypothetical protein
MDPELRKENYLFDYKTTPLNMYKLFLVVSDISWDVRHYQLALLYKGNRPFFYLLILLTILDHFDFYGKSS